MTSKPDTRRLIEDNLGYVRAIATQVRKDVSASVEFDELVACGSKGLVEAAERFDPSRGASFTTYAYYRIRGAMFDGLRQLGWMRRTTHARFTAAADEYLANLGDRVPDQPVATSTEDRVAELGQALDDVAAIFVTSLAALPQEPADVAQVDASEAIEQNQARLAVQQALTKLPEKERRLLELHYFQDLNLQDAGRELGLSKSWASRLHARAVQLMARQLKHLE
jgi:RNA polymerase sigma factor FliA